MSVSHRLSVALLGPDIDHKTSLEAMLDRRVSKLTWLPDSASLLRVQTQGIVGGIRRALNQLTYTHDGNFLEEARRHLDDNCTDVIIAYWGTGPLADIAAIKRLRPHIKIVLVILCFPLALNAMGVERQHWMMRHAAPCLDGILYSNTVMQEYFRGQVLHERGSHLKELVLRPCWPQDYQSAAERCEMEFDGPNLIYVGRTDLSHRTVHAADDLRPMMAEILKNKIELHHARSSETTDGNPYRRPFDPINQKGLIAKMGSHDASLIAYNAAACQKTDRLELTVPDRLITSVAAGVPIAIPSIGYRGAKQYLADYPAVIEFESITDLKRQLEDRERIKATREAAWQARKLYTAEMQGDLLQRLLVAI